MPSETLYLLADPRVINNGEIEVDLGTIVETPDDRFVIDGAGWGPETGGRSVHLMTSYTLFSEFSARLLREDRRSAIQHCTYALNGQTVLLTPAAIPERWDIAQRTAKLIGAVILPPDNLQVPTPDSPFRKAFLEWECEKAGIDPKRLR